MEIAIFLTLCFIVGLLLAVCMRMKTFREIMSLGMNNQKSYAETYIWMMGNMQDEIMRNLPNTFEYNGNKGKVYHK